MRQLLLLRTLCELPNDQELCKFYLHFVSDSFPSVTIHSFSMNNIRGVGGKSMGQDSSTFYLSNQSSSQREGVGGKQFDGCTSNFPGEGTAVPRAFSSRPFWVYLLCVGLG